MILHCTFPTLSFLKYNLLRLKKENGGEDEFYANMNLTHDQDEMIKDDLALNIQVENLRSKIFEEISEPNDKELNEYYLKIEL